MLLLLLLLSVLELIDNPCGKIYRRAWTIAKSTCRDLWMEVMLKLVTVAIVQATALCLSHSGVQGKIHLILSSLCVCIQVEFFKSLPGISPTSHVKQIHQLSILLVSYGQGSQRPFRIDAMRSGARPSHPALRQVIPGSQNE